jgi:hypothetical protein
VSLAHHQVQAQTLHDHTRLRPNLLICKEGLTAVLVQLHQQVTRVLQALQTSTHVHIHQFRAAHIVAHAHHVQCFGGLQLYLQVEDRQ